VAVKDLARDEGRGPLEKAPFGKKEEAESKPELEPEMHMQRQESERDHLDRHKTYRGTGRYRPRLRSGLLCPRHHTGQHSWLRQQSWTCTNERTDVPAECKAARGVREQMQPDDLRRDRHRVPAHP
jgi:hypothetical protein